MSTGARVPADFAARFTLVASVLFLLYAFPYEDYGVGSTWADGYLAAYARLAGAVLSLFEPNVNVHGNTIAAAVSLRIVKSCDAMEANVLLTAALVAFPGAPLRKVLAIAAGLALIAAANVTRITTLYYLLLRHEASFERFHHEIWPLVLVVSALAVFIAGVRFLQAPREQSHGTGRGTAW